MSWVVIYGFNESYGIESIGEKRYLVVVIDDYPRYSWIEFLKGKSKTFSFFNILYKKN